HGVKECNGIPTDERDKKEDELPYSFVLKPESSLLEKESLKSDFSTKKSVKQCSYIGDVAVFNGVYGKFSEDDSNKIMYSFEKAGGMPREERRMEAFQDVLEECQLMDVGYLEEWFTLERGNLPKTNIRER
ncbi:hypothetical protein Gohar_027237, partial [Gossypium harknessii]|nr:hypothetical protein [Gossypium harknessii]